MMFVLIRMEHWTRPSSPIRSPAFDLHDRRLVNASRPAIWAMTRRGGCQYKDLTDFSNLAGFGPIRELKMDSCCHDSWLYLLLFRYKPKIEGIGKPGPPGVLFGWSICSTSNEHHISALTSLALMPPDEERTQDGCFSYSMCCGQVVCIMYVYIYILRTWRSIAKPYHHKAVIIHNKVAL